MKNKRPHQQLPFQEFLETIYNSYKHKILQKIHKYVGDSPEAEDIFQEVFLQLTKNVDKLMSLSKPKLEAYIIFVTQSRSIDYLRKKHPTVQIDEVDDIIDQAVCNVFSKVNLFVMMESLSPEERILLKGRYYLNFSIDELAQITGKKPAAIKSKIHYAKIKLCKLWKESGLSIGDFINE